MTIGIIAAGIAFVGIVIPGWTLIISEITYHKRMQKKLSWKLPFSNKRIMVKATKAELYFYLIEGNESAGAMVQLCSWINGKWCFRERHPQTVNQQITESKLCRYVNILRHRYAERIYQLQIESTKLLNK